MDEYINKTKLIEDMKSRFCEGCDPGSGHMRCRMCEVSYAIGELKGAPTADVEEVKHGEWFLLDDCANEGVYCSVCHKKVYKKDYANQKLKSPRCPNCGAKMDGGAD